MHAFFNYLLKNIFAKHFHQCVAGALNGTSFITNALESTDNKECDFNEPNVQQRPPVDVFKKVLGNVILKSGKVVSLTILNQKGFFQKNTQGFSGKSLMEKVCTSQITMMTSTKWN